MRRTLSAAAAKAQLSEALRQAENALAHGEAPELDRPTHRWLRRWELIDDQRRLTIPVLGRFFEEPSYDVSRMLRVGERHRRASSSKSSRLSSMS